MGPTSFSEELRARRRAERARRGLERHGARRLASCPACGLEVLDSERSIDLYDATYHADCALYRSESGSGDRGETA